MGRSLGSGFVSESTVSGVSKPPLELSAHGKGGRSHHQDCKSKPRGAGGGWGGWEAAPSVNIPDSWRDVRGKVQPAPGLSKFTELP